MGSSFEKVLKEHLAEKVREALDRSEYLTGYIRQLMPDVEDVEVQETDSLLSTVIRVTTGRHGTMYFEVRLKGMI